LPELGIVVVPHPFSGVDPAEVRKKADSAIDMVIATLMGSRGVPRDEPG
jgi:hypothetical protein